MNWSWAEKLFDFVPFTTWVFCLGLDVVKLCEMARFDDQFVRVLAGDPVQFSIFSHLGFYSHFRFRSRLCFFPSTASFDSPEQLQFYGRERDGVVYIYRDQPRAGKVLRRDQPRTGKVLRQGTGRTGVHLSRSGASR